MIRFSKKKKTSLFHLLLTLLDHVVESPDRLLHRRLFVGPVRQVHVDVTDPQALKRRVEGLDHMLPRKARLVHSSSTPEHLRRQHERRAGPGQRAQGLAHDLLGLPAVVDLGVVEEVDAGVSGAPHYLGGGAGVDPVAEGYPGPEGEDGDLLFCCVLI